MNDRSKYLGGSDVAAVLGVSPWTTPLELWQEKTGRKASDYSDPKRVKTLERGKRLEPFIRDMAVDKLRDLGLTVEVIGCNRRFVDPLHEFLSCEIDFELLVTGTIVINGSEVIFDRELINADAKSVTGFARRKWGEVDTEEVPVEYAAQFMHGLAITDRHYCLVAALRSFDDVDLYWTVRDDETIAAMRDKCVRFWRDHVLEDVPPDPLTFDDVKALFPVDNGLSIEATEEIAEAARKFLEVRANRIEFEKAEDDLKLQLVQYIAPHTRLTFQGEDLITWKGQNDTRLDQEALRREQPALFQQYQRSKIIRVIRQAPRSKRGKLERGRN